MMILMKVIKEGHRPPKDFTATCEKFGYRGCRAILHVSKEDCFVQDDGDSCISFFCGCCGLVLTPDKDKLDPADVHDLKCLNEVREDGKRKWPLKTKDNCPPWSHVGLPTMEEFCKQNHIKWGFR
jgi:hypothetical protein